MVGSSRHVRTTRSKNHRAGLAFGRMCTRGNLLVSHLAFILGVPRSGTTWMWGLLTSHPDVIPLTRDDFVPGNPSVVDGRRVTSETGAFLHFTDAFIQANIHAKRNAFPGKTIIEKTPLHTLQIARILNLFPEARLIYMMRDPRAVVSSILHSTFLPFTRSLRLATGQYRKFVECASPYFGSPHCAVVRYEDLLMSPLQALTRVAYLLDLDASHLQAMIDDNAGRVKVDVSGVFRKGRADSYLRELRIEQVTFIETALGDLLDTYYPDAPRSVRVRSQR